MVGTGSHIGRPFSKVWSYFTEVILEESGEGAEKKEKKKQKCNHCENLVSSKATRLRDHLIKCQGIFMNETEPPEVVLEDSGNVEAVTPVAVAVTSNIGDRDEDDQGPSMDNTDDSFESCPRPKVSSKSSAKKQAETMLIGQMYKKMTALETKVNRLETELRHVRKKMLLYETNCVTNIINQFKEQKFSLTLNPIVDHVGRINESGNDLNNDYAPQIPTRGRNRKFGSTPVLVTNDQDSGSGSNTSGTHSDSYQNNSSLLPDISSTPTKRKRPRTTIKRPIRAKSPKDGPPAKGGRRTDTIWDHFNISNDANGKRITFCKICESLVSARAPRLRSHLEVCSNFNTNPNSDNPVNIKRETEFYIQDEDDQEDDSFQDENELMDTVAPDRNVTTDGNITLVLDDN